MLFSCEELKTDIAQVVKDIRYLGVINQETREQFFHRQSECIDYASVAQLVEQLICNQQVAGSIPVGGSIDYA